MGRKSFGSFLDASFMSVDMTFKEHVSDRLSFTPLASNRKNKRKRLASRDVDFRSAKRTPRLSNSLKDISNVDSILSGRKRKLSVIPSSMKKIKRDTSFENIVNKAEKLYLEGKYSEAKAIYQELLGHSCHLRHIMVSNIALCELFCGNYMSAMKIIRETTKPTLQSHFLTAKIFIFQGLIEKALPHIEAIVSNKKKDSNEFCLLKNIDLKKEARLLIKTGSKYEKLMTDINKKLFNENAIEAFKLAQKCEELAPKCIRVWLIKVVANFLQIALFKSSSGYFNESDSRDTIPESQVSQINFKTKALQKELKEIVKSTESDNDQQQVLYKSFLYFANMFLKQAFLNEASYLLKVLLKYQKINQTGIKNLLVRIEDMDKTLALGVKAVKRNELDNAIRHFTKCLDFDKENSKFNGRVLFRRAAVYFDQNNFDKAVDDYKACLEKLPNYDKAVFKLSEALCQEKKYDEAIKYLEILYKKKRTKEISFEVRRLKILKERDEFRKKKAPKTPSPRRHKYNTRYSAKQQKQKRTLYDILGVRKQASKATIKKAFRKLALKLHPDKQKNNGKEHNEKFQELNSAYTVLYSPEQRRRYDLSLR